MIGRLLAAALLLTLVITTSSAFMRLNQTIGSCADWTSCRDRASSSSTAHSAPNVAVGIARVVHRLAASTVGMLVLIIVALLWKHSPGMRTASAVLLLLTASLAVLGRFTPSELPVVTLANLLGGMAIAGTLGWLRVATSWQPPARTQRPVLFALMVLSLQIAIGGLVSARDAALSCPSFGDCLETFRTFDWHGFDVLRANASLSRTAPRTIYGTHQLFALFAVIAVLAVWSRVRKDLHQRRPRVILLGLVILQIVLGAAMAIAGSSITLAVTHNLCAVLIIIVLATMLRAGVVKGEMI
ncbi:MAG TPA: COX15/CtaA family protein [Burkholderiales bacterium]|nr:COX15/CtaA family protein [Burkholderiales bacterium]